MMSSHTDESERLSRSTCPVANALELFGDRWTLLIVRDLLLGKNFYREFLASDEAISTNILADRLRNLQNAGIVRKGSATDPNGRAYFLSEKGEELLQVLNAISAWGEKYIPGVECFPRYERSK
ncbi:MAG: helix-turn-helix transcriptional regulator [Methylococcaceae bacterium]|nr:helix-turn-helix transcriptional regulator [Methylococcaceae bacterium]MCI0668677.1 helix-turn-helix transcriptional regulator [Methylococcaceae bacterium]